MFNEWAQGMNESFYDALAERKEKWDDLLQNARDNFEDRQTKAQHRIDEAMENVQPTADFIDSIDGLPLNEMVEKIVDAVKYDHQSITVYDVISD